LLERPLAPDQRTLSYLFPETYGVDILQGAIRHKNALPLALDFLIIAAFCVALFAMSLKNIHRKWIV
jgi:ABC-2 type transport system permease protein